MELRHLRYFVAIGEEQHYGRAARRLRVAQPALSRQIQDLEKELGFKLFERLARGVKLNAAGKLFLEDARRVLQELSEAAVRAGFQPISLGPRILRTETAPLAALAALQVLWAAKTLHPARFPDLDLRKETKAFYTKFFDHTLTDAEYDSIMRAAAP